MIVALNVNGRRYDVNVEPRRTLADALREDCGLTGTHVGCEHGVCGACTVLADGEAVRACLMFAVQAEGVAIRTVEGLARDGVLHPLQQAFCIDHHALQCRILHAEAFFFLMLAVKARWSGSQRWSRRRWSRCCRPICAVAPVT